MILTPKIKKFLCLLCAVILLLSCAACNPNSGEEQESTAPSAGTEPTTEPTTEAEPESTAPTESTTEPTEPSTEPTEPSTEPTEPPEPPEPPEVGPVYDAAELPACDSEVLAENASIPIVIWRPEDDGSVVAYRSTWDITKGTLSEKTPCFSYDRSVMFMLDYWDGASLFWADGADSATILGDYVVERTPRGLSFGGGGRCRYRNREEELSQLQESGEQLALPAAVPPDFRALGIPQLMNEPLYAHYNGEKILLVYHGFAESHLDLLYTWYEPENAASASWKHLTIQTEYAAVSGANWQACYCDGLLYIPGYNDVYVINTETGDVSRVADIDPYVAMVPELAETPWKECVTIKGCYEDIVVVSLQLNGEDGSTQYHELAIRQGRIIGSYSIIIAANNDRTLLLLDEKGEILYSDDTLVPQNSVPTFPRID